MPVNFRSKRKLKNSTFLNLSAFDAKFFGQTPLYVLDADTFRSFIRKILSVSKIYCTSKPRRRFIMMHQAAPHDPYNVWRRSIPFISVNALDTGWNYYLSPFKRLIASRSLYMHPKTLKSTYIVYFTLHYDIP